MNRISCHNRGYAFKGLLAVKMSFEGKNLKEMGKWTEDV